MASSSLTFAQATQDNQAPAYPQQQYPQQQYPQQQASPNPSGGWRRVGDPPQTADSVSPSDPMYAPDPNAQSNDPNNQGNQPYNQGPNQPANQGPNQPYYGPNNGPNGGPNQQQYNNQPIPAQLTIRPGTFITARVNQVLSSDHNQTGDAFTATLVRPIVVDGVVVAEPGQTIGGRVTEAVKAGRVQGTSRLGIQLTDLTLVDGQQLPIQTQFVVRRGGTSIGRDAAAIGGTTAFGAAVGAAAAGGFGAGLGAAAGVVASTVGVLITRGNPTVVDPETVLTFRVEAPITISTVRAPQAFHFIEPEEYTQNQNGGRMQMAGNGYGPGYPPPPAYGAYYGAPYPYYYGYPYYYPGFSFFVGSGFYGRGFYPGFYGYRGGYYGGYRGGIGGYRGGYGGRR